MASMIKENMEIILERIELAADRAGRRASDIALMGVSKNQTREAVVEAYKAGITLFGENRVLEGEEKFRDFEGDAVIHLIGHLQRNKAKVAASAFSCIQSIDKLETAAALSKYLVPLEKEMDIFIEVNTSKEDSKNGCSGETELFLLIDGILELKRLSIKGLMTLGPLTGDKEKIRKSFAELRELLVKAKRRYPAQSISELSMGMSSDYEIAIEEGSTIVRIGTSLFGQRQNG